jgi:hypothetical protein
MEPTSVTFEDIKTKEYFMRDGDLYLRIVPEFEMATTGTVVKRNAVCLKSGESVTCDKSDVVQIVSSVEFIVNVQFKISRKQ